MNKEKKVELISELKEKELRETLLLPLLTKMGFIDPIIHHHSNEKGKDIVCKEYDSKFKKFSYIAVIVKAADITGAVTGNDSYFTVINQVKQSINEPYKHIYELKEVTIDKCIIITNGRFLATSLESIYNTLKAEKIDKVVREAIDVNKLVDLIDEFYPEYWEEIIDATESLVEQRNYLLNNVSKLIKLLIKDPKSQQLALNSVLSNSVDFELFPYSQISKYIADIGYKKITIDEVDEFFTDEDIGNSHSDLKDYVFKLKKDAQSILFEIDEVIEILKKILDEKDPLKIYDHCADLKGHINGYGSFSFNSHDIAYQDDFYYGLIEYKTKKELLIENKLYDFYKEIISQIRKSLYDPVKNYIYAYRGKEKDFWLAVEIKYSNENKKVLDIKTNHFVKKPNQVKGDFDRMEYQLYTVTNELNCVKIEIALGYKGIWNEDKLKTEDIIKEFTEMFIQKFSNAYLKLLGYDVE